MSRVRKHLNFENVLVTAVAFAVLAGGTAFAANQLAKNSVGKKQLKANAVTTAKIKKNAVTAAKIKAGAVDGTKVKDGSLTSASLNLVEMPFSRIVHEVRASSTIDVGTTLTVYPLGPAAAYTQQAGEDDLYSATLDITFSSGCEAGSDDRSAEALLLVDSANPTDPLDGDLVAAGEVEDEAVGTVTKQVSLGGSDVAGARFQSAVATNHTLSMVVEAECKAGSGVTASNAAVDVIGVGR